VPPRVLPDWLAMRTFVWSAPVPIGPPRPKRRREVGLTAQPSTVATLSKVEGNNRKTHGHVFGPLD
jgi:hypothetical protein